ncbi:protein MODIFIER OF SNC1 1 [Benincasa hispida]|uniref:protein MODIFIER OF SNC1 1 n=1 Tax=Benincasa hispida TaxID=102211 RepID=UPI001902AC83|nr:protein MODIFIER OF SNC1 1 [Benincasa hispida]
MTSSMLSGERRWTSARRGGMTVLGKVAVPKPINLPSQRLENHGLDPNVEIVPKGTLSWGNKSTSSATNAWGSSSVSPNTDSASGSPSHLCGRPSSAGGGTRPSTAGSDRSHEPHANAWGPSSRPSSASGPVTLSGHASLTSLRPHSAETKSSSSQLSRFAETSENPGAWNSALTTEKVGMMPCKSDGFSLTSGDFPTLGSEKECVGKDAESQDNRSNGGATMKEGTGTSAIDDPENVNTSVASANSWRNDNLPHNDDGSRPNVEKWLGHPQPYPGANIPPPHYDAWHGNPVNNPQGGVWYRGPPQGGPPYRTPVAPGNFPMDPFLYYPPQIPPGGLPNPQPPHGTGPRGLHPKTGDIYRPPMHDGFIHPGMSIRPGFYPGPVTYDGYYRPPMGYCNSNDRDAPFMGMPAGPAGPAVYNRFLGQGQSASDPASSHGLSSGKGMVPEQVESSLPCDNQGPYKVLLKQQGNINGKNEEKDRINSTTTNQLILEKADQQRVSPFENDWDHKKEVDLRRRKLGVEPYSQSSANQDAQSSESMKTKSHGNSRTGDGLLEKVDAPASGFSEVPKSLATSTKDSSLIQKIEGLNAKARASDVRHDAAPICGREEPDEFQSDDKHSDHFVAHEVVVSAVFPENRDFNEVLDPASSELTMSTVDRNVKLHSGAPTHRRPNRGMQGRSDHHGRGKVNAQEVDGWHKRPLLDSPGMMATPNQESSVLARDRNALGAIHKAKPFSSDSHGDGPAPSIGDSNDSQAQRTKMRELAKQRTKQLQEEEEERTRKQRARALAKLEELNRRTVAGEGPNQSFETDNDAIRNKMEEPNSRTLGTISGEHTTVSDLHVATNDSESTLCTNKNSPIVSGDTSLKKPNSGNKEQVVAHNELRSLEQEVSISDAAQSKNASEVNGGGASLKHKRTGKQKPNIPSEKTEKIPHLIKESKGQIVVAEIQTVVEESSNIITDPVAESSTHARKKNNKSGKNRHKVEEALLSASSPQISKEAMLTTEYDKPRASQSVMDPPSDPQPPDENQFREQQPLLPVVETLGKGNGQWKSQHSRRMPRNAQNRPGEKIHGSDSVIWAPVRSLNKCEVTDETIQKNEAESVASSVKIDNQVQNIPKNKRAEREIYVPKPVAKELAQQGTIHQDISPMNQAPDDNKADSSSQSSDNTRSAGAVSGNVGFSTDHRNGDGRHHKQSKAHASWQQRGSTEYGQGLQDQSSYVSNAGSHVQKTVEYQLPEKATGSSTNEFVSQIDEWDPPEGWNDPNYSASIPPVTVAVGRDQGVTGRGKRSQSKGHKGISNNYDLNEKKFRSGDNEKISSDSEVLEADQKDVSAAAKENWGVGERSTSHWQPKARMVQQPHNYQNVDAEAAQTNKMGPRLTSHRIKTSDDVAQNQYDTSTGARTITEEGSNVGHHGARGEKKISSRKERPYSPNQGPIRTVDVAPANTDVRREQQLPTFYHKGGENNNRYGRGSESRRERNTSQHHKQHHHPPANRDRQRQNLQYEYQPVGSHNSKPNNDRPKDTTQHSSSRYVERGQGQSRRDGGNFYKQQGGPV